MGKILRILGIFSIFFIYAQADEPTSTVSPALIQEFWSQFSGNGNQIENQKAADKFIAEQDPKTQTVLKSLLSQKFAQTNEEVEKVKTLIGSLNIGDAAKKYVAEATQVWMDKTLTLNEKKQKFDAIKATAEADPAATTDFKKIESAVQSIVIQSRK